MEYFHVSLFGKTHACYASVCWNVSMAQLAISEESKVQERHKIRSSQIQIETYVLRGVKSINTYTQIKKYNLW